ncbi:hypothetical protein ACGFNY_04840 [Streptomyces chartreusis]|uniref:hypothetical protein n=1 Tax=Streptomyces chartreusis TaxID=1969 RepID=UPI00371BF4F1
MSARETLNRWVEAMQILCGSDDNPGPERRDGYDSYRQAMLNAAYSEVVAERDAEMVAWLTKKAREGFPGADVLASKVARGAVRPDNLRMLPPDFFEAGRTYTEPDGSTDWAFRVDTITTHPEDGERTALGWRRFRGEWTECAYGEDDFEIHLIADAIAVTEDGAS